MRTLTKITVLLAVTALASGPALAGHIDLPVKWSQPPDMDQGVDHTSIHVGPAVCTNDWQCDDPAPIVAVRWWGSYLDGYEPDDGGMIPFELVFHFDLPANMVDPETGEQLAYSHPTNPPGALLPMWFNIVAQEDFYGTTVGGEKVYEYNAYLAGGNPEFANFDQLRWINDGNNPVAFHNIFWLDIGYEDLDGNDNPLHHWGWHDANTLVLDNSISNPGWHFGPWNAVTVLETDLAFELMIPEPGTVSLVAFGGVALLWRRRKRLT